MSDTLFKASSLPGTTEAVVDCVPSESGEDPSQAAALVEHVDHRSGADPQLKITGGQTIRTADEPRRTLAEYLDRGLAVVLDLSELDECEAAALQLIYALRQSAVQYKQRFHITAGSPAVKETAAAFGLHVEALMTACAPATTDGDSKVAGKDNGI